MRIGLFTDTYRPTINGIVYVVDSLKTQLEALGHEVFVVCPARSIAPSLKKKHELDDEHIIRIPSVKSGFFDDFDITLFFPPTMLKRLKELELDVIHILTPSQVGLLGIDAALRHHKPLVVQHATDLYEFAENYPSTLAGTMALVGIVFPMSVQLNKHDVGEIIRLYRPQSGITKWNQAMIARSMTMLYSKADAVIALSRKSYKQLQGWQDKVYRYEITLLPNGVDALPKPSAAKLRAFRKKWHLDEHDEVYGFVGRLGEEKNLPVLIEAFDIVGRERPKAKLLFVGDFVYRKTLEAMAAQSDFPERIIFTGAIPREELGVAYAALSVFTFPSLKDTQGWVLPEAAHAGLPIVLIDREVSEVVEDGRSGYFAHNTAEDVARKVVDLLKDPAKRAAFGAHAVELAARYSEKEQTMKVVELYEKVIAKKEVRATPRKSLIGRLFGGKRTHEDH